MDARDIIAPAAAITIATSASAVPVSAAYDSQLNQPSTWGNSCLKIDMGGSEVMTYTVTDPTATKVIVKGGTENAVYETAPFTNLTAPINPRTGKPYAISHVIVCTGSAQQTTETPSTPTNPSTPSTNGGGQGQGHVNGVTTNNNDDDNDNGHTLSTSDSGTGSGSGSVQGASAVATDAKVTTTPDKIASTGSAGLLTAVSTAGAGAAAFVTSHLFRRKQ